MTTAVYFDLDGTLVGYDRDFDAMLADALPTTPTEAMQETFVETLVGGLDGSEPDPYVAGVAAVCETHGLSGDPEALATERVDLEVDASRSSPAARRLLGTVGDRHAVGVLTNGYEPVQRRKLAAADLLDPLDALVVSHAVGAAKPDPAVFAAAEDRLPGQQHVYVADDYEGDLVPAADRGWVTVGVGTDDGPAATATVETLEDLASLLEALVDG